jgi:hypothetical protein
LNNLGFALYEAGRKEKALTAFEKSLSVYGDQQHIKQFLNERFPK